MTYAMDARPNPKVAPGAACKRARREAADPESSLGEAVVLEAGLVPVVFAAGGHAHAVGLHGSADLVTEDLDLDVSREGEGIAGE